MITKNYIILSKKGLFHEVFMKLFSLNKKQTSADKDSESPDSSDSFLVWQTDNA